MTPRSVLQVLRWLVLALALMAAGAATAQDSAPLNLDATQAALNTIDSTLKDPNLTDADLQRLRAQSDPLGVALQAAIADMTPKLAASDKRLAELTPKSKDAAPPTDAATAELESEKAKHDALDARLRAARAMLLQVDDDATRIGARRRELFARETFARSSSILNPQLWLSVWSEIPLDAQVMTALVGGWLASLGGRATVLHMLVLAGLAVLLALIAVPLRWFAGRFIYRPVDDDHPSRLRRAIAVAWIILVFAVLPLLWLGAFAYALDFFDISEPRIQGVLDALFDAARLLIVFNALGRGMLAPRDKSWRSVGAWRDQVGCGACWRQRPEPRLRLTVCLWGRTRFQRDKRRGAAWSGHGNSFGDAVDFPEDVSWSTVSAELAYHSAK